MMTRSSSSIKIDKSPSVTSRRSGAPIFIRDIALSHQDSGWPAHDLGEPIDESDMSFMPVLDLRTIGNADSRPWLFAAVRASRASWSWSLPVIRYGVKAIPVFHQLFRRCRDVEGLPRRAASNQNEISQYVVDRGTAETTGNNPGGASPGRMETQDRIVPMVQHTPHTVPHIRLP